MSATIPSQRSLTQRRGNNPTLIASNAPPYKLSLDTVHPVGVDGTDETDA